MAVNSRQSLKEYCLKNKYSSWYFSLLDKATIRGWTKDNAPCYVETHHVVPRSISGEKPNEGDRVCLTAREHFVAHMLLSKMFEDNKSKYKMVWALHRLVNGNDNIYCKSSQIYAQLRESARQAASIRSKKYWEQFTKEERSAMRSGEKNGRYGKEVSQSTRELIGNANRGKLAGDKHPLFNKGHTEESKKKMSANRIGKTVGVKNGMYGKVGRATGKTWYHDPLTGETKYFVRGTQPSNFILGRK